MFSTTPNIYFPVAIILNNFLLQNFVAPRALFSRIFSPCYGRKIAFGTMRRASQRASNKFSSLSRSLRITVCVTRFLALPRRFAELDLDYLERRGGNTITYEGADSGSKEEDSPADTLDRVKVVFLGAPGVGKTSIIRVSHRRRRRCDHSR